MCLTKKVSGYGYLSLDFRYRRIGSYNVDKPDKQ